MLDTNTPPKMIPMIEQKDVGTQCAIQTLYEAAPDDDHPSLAAPGMGMGMGMPPPGARGPYKRSPRHAIKWVEECPDYPTIDPVVKTKEAPRAIEDGDKALVVRMRRSWALSTQPGKLLEVDSVTVQSSSLRRTLKDVFFGYKGPLPPLHVPSASFSPPFRCFHFRWARFTQTLERQKEQDPAAAAFTQLLHDFLYPKLQHDLTQSSNLLGQGVITYRLLWAAFEPGTLVFAELDGRERLFLANSTSDEAHPDRFRLVLSFYDWDGEDFGYATTDEIRMSPFFGTRRMADLDAFPAHLHPSWPETRARLLARGRKFQSLAGVQYKAISKPARDRGKTAEKSGKVDHAEERIMIDAASFCAHTDKSLDLDPVWSASYGCPGGLPPPPDGHNQRFSQGWAGFFRPKVIGVRAPSCSSRPSSSSSSSSSNSESNTKVGGEGEEETDDYDSSYCESDASETTPLTDTQLLLCNSTVRGFYLRTKKWSTFDVERVKDIAWNEEAFSKLLLPEGYKNLLLSFLNGQARNKKFQDIIADKGLGLVLLFAGSPGIGKTLTAEAVADVVRKPLYVLSAGELKLKKFEKSLKSALKLAEEWEAIVLLDECDVLMQQRSVSHLQHNEVMTIFLRALDYYKGVFIMTTNRDEEVDKAFQSRVHLTLRYPELDRAKREQIWRQFVARADPGNGMTGSDYRTLAQMRMNGRQIRNTVKMAAILAIEEGQELGTGQVRTVLQATQDIDAGALEPSVVKRWCASLARRFR